MSFYQLKIGAEWKQYFVGDIFKTAPKGYYQILNIWGLKGNNTIYILITNIEIKKILLFLFKKII